MVVINLWATWCAPCKAGLPTPDGLYTILNDKELRVFVLTTEDALPLWRLEPLAAALHIPMVRRMKEPCRTLAAMPTNYVIDRAGIIRYAKAAAFDLDALNALLIEARPAQFAAR